MADGQVTRGGEVVKPNVKKVRTIGDNVIGGFAGTTADAFALFEQLEMQLEKHPGKPSFPRILLYTLLAVAVSLTCLNASCHSH